MPPVHLPWSFLRAEPSDAVRELTEHRTGRLRGDADYLWSRVVLFTRAKGANRHIHHIRDHGIDTESGQRRHPGRVVDRPGVDGQPGLVGGLDQVRGHHRLVGMDGGVAAVGRPSSSTPSAPSRLASMKASRVFSGLWAEAPRWPRISGATAAGLVMTFGHRQFGVARACSSERQEIPFSAANHITTWAYAHVNVLTFTICPVLWGGGHQVALTWSRSIEWDIDDWRTLAACRDTDPDLFFPVGTT